MPAYETISWRVRVAEWLKSMQARAEWNPGLWISRWITCGQVPRKIGLHLICSFYKKLRDQTLSPLRTSPLQKDARCARNRGDTLRRVKRAQRSPCFADHDGGPR